MKKCAFLMLLCVLLFPALVQAQTDTVDVQDFYETSGTEGTLNTAVQAKIDAGTLSNTVFRLKSFGLYVLSGTIRVPPGQKLTLVAPTPGTDQNSAPPMICWTASSGISQTFNFDCFGDVSMKNIWLLYATTNQEGLGTQVGSALEIDEDTTDHLNYGTFENVIFDYAPISNGGGSVTVSASHARLKFENCYFRNNTDTHFRYYGRAVSFPFNTSGWHIDSCSFVNTTFANMGYVFMQEGAEYADYLKFNHCTFLNTVMYTLESGWWHWLSITNSVFVNPYMFGYIPAVDGATTPYGGAINIDSIGTTNFNFTVPWTEADRHIVFTNNSYGWEPWLINYETPFDPTTNPTGGNPYHNRLAASAPDSMPRYMPLMSEKTRTFFNNKTTWPHISLGTVIDSTVPGFLIPPTNQDGIKSFLLRKWTDNSDTTWAFDPNADLKQVWPVNEQLRYSNAKLKTAAMDGSPLGDIYRWWNSVPSIYANWNAQRAKEDQTIETWLNTTITGVADHPTAVPLTFDLAQNYPNPFNPSTKISYTVPQKSTVTLKVFNVLGMEVATLVAGVQEPGEHVATFNAGNLASGVYFYRLQAAGLSMTRKMMFVK